MKKTADLLTLMGSPRLEQLLTASQAADVAGYCYDHFQELCRSGQLPRPALEQRGRYFYHRRDVRGLKAKRRKRRRRRWTIRQARVEIRRRSREG